MHITVTDTCLRDIEDTVGTRPPESGGALMGPRHSTLVTKFIFDMYADTTGASYVPSRQLDQQVKELERDNPNLVLKGILHSHPGGMNRPSTTDEVSFNDYLAANPNMEFFAAIICTFRGIEAAFNELLLGQMRISFFTATRSMQRANVRPTRPRIQPIGLLEQEVQAKGGKTQALGEAALGEVGCLSFEVIKSGLPIASISLPETFPESAPVVYTISGREVEPASVRWDAMTPTRERLQAFVSTLMREGYSVSEPIAGKNQAGNDPATKSPTDDNTQVNRQAQVMQRAAKTVRTLMSIAARAGAPNTKGRIDLLARTGGILSPTVASKKVLILGCGSVGSTVAMQLARSGMGSMTLIDSERVESANVGRSSYFSEAIGEWKVSALASMMRRINPHLTVQAYNSTLQSLDHDLLKRLVDQSDVVVGASDDPVAQASLAHIGYQLQVPGVFVAVYAKASGGELVLNIPGKACHNCAIRGRIDGGSPDQGPRQVDYGTGRLAAEPGLYADVSVLSDFAAKLVLALSPDLPTDSPLRRGFTEAILGEDSLTYVLVGNSPDFMFFNQPDMLGAAPNQHALQSMWLHVEKQEECSTCGPSRGSLFRVSSPDAGVLARRLTTRG